MIRYLVAALIVLPAATAAQTPAPNIPAAERTAIFKAAGAVQSGGQWYLCAEDPNRTPSTIDRYADLNGDGRPEAVITDGGTFCYGMAGTGFQLVSKQLNGSWKVVAGEIGIPEFLPIKGVGGWPDIMIGGPGFCFPVQRWNGHEYALHRFEYEGRSCKPPR